jgi:hypothetical protein
MLLLEIAKFATQAGIGKPTTKDIVTAAVLVVKLTRETFPAGTPGPATPAPLQRLLRPLQRWLWRHLHAKNSKQSFATITL